MAPEPLPAVSVVIAARNAARTLRACLVSLMAQRHHDYEVTVVDDGSTDGTRAIAASIPGVRVLDGGGHGPSAARNAGVQAARHDIVAFTDADCTVPPDWLERLVVALRDSQAASVGGPQRNVFEASAVAQDFSPANTDIEALNAFFELASSIAEYTRSDAEPRFVDHNASCNSAYIKDAFLEVGGFSEGLWPGEDVDLDLRLRRLGYRCYYVPEAFVWHHRPATREWFAGMMRRYGRAQRELVKRHGRFRALHWLPVALAAAAAAQLLSLNRSMRPVVAVADGALVAAAATILAMRVPPRLWVPVARYAGVAVVEWNRGYLQPSPAPPEIA